MVKIIKFSNDLIDKYLKSSINNLRNQNLTQLFTNLLYNLLLWLVLIFIGIFLDYVIKGMPPYYFIIIPNTPILFLKSRWGYLLFFTGILVLLLSLFNPFTIKLNDVIKFRERYIYNNLNNSATIIYKCSNPLFFEYSDLKEFLINFDLLTLEIDTKNYSFTFIISKIPMSNLKALTEDSESKLQSLFDDVLLMKGDLLKYQFWTGYKNHLKLGIQREITSIKEAREEIVILFDNDIENTNLVDLNSTLKVKNEIEYSNNEYLFVFNFKTPNKNLGEYKNAEIYPCYLYYQLLTPETDNISSISINVNKMRLNFMKNYGLRYFANNKPTNNKNSHNTKLISYLFHKILKKNKTNLTDIFSSTEEINLINIENKNINIHEEDSNKQIKNFPKKDHLLVSGPENKTNFKDKNGNSNNFTFYFTPICLYLCSNYNQVYNSGYFKGDNMFSIPKVCSPLMQKNEIIFYNNENLMNIPNNSNSPDQQLSIVKKIYDIIKIQNITKNEKICALTYFILKNNIAKFNGNNEESMELIVDVKNKLNS